MYIKKRIAPKMQPRRIPASRCRAMERTPLEGACKHRGNLISQSKKECWIPLADSFEMKVGCQKESNAQEMSGEMALTKFEIESIHSLLDIEAAARPQ